MPEILEARTAPIATILARRPQAGQARYSDEHTAGSHMANHEVDLRHVRDNLGHESISTTSHYLHSTDDKRHEATELKHKIKW